MKKYNRANITGPVPETGARFERFELGGVFPGRATKSPGKLTDAALPTWRPAQFIFCRWYFLRVHGPLRRKNNLGDNAKVALRAGFRSATDPVLLRGHRRRGNNNGDAAVVAT